MVKLAVAEGVAVAIAEHQNDEYAHARAVAEQIKHSAPMRQKVERLWDERNQWRGLMTTAMIAGPLLAVVLDHIWR